VADVIATRTFAARTQERARAALRFVRERPELGLLLVLTAATRLWGLGWGLPASDGWDNDGIAPRDALAGLVETFTPGHHFTYPPVHLALVTLLSLPFWLPPLLRLPSFKPEVVVPAMLDPQVMTGVAYVARLITVCMSLGCVLLTYRLAERASNRTGGFVAGLFAALGGAYVYYGHTTNLDTAQLFWSLLAYHTFLDAVAQRAPQRLTRVALISVVGVCTKDQAYGAFLLTWPVAVGAWAWLCRDLRGPILKASLRGTAVAVVTFGFLSSAFVNPVGFRERVRFLLGPASQDSALYTRDLASRLLILRDVGQKFPMFYPWLALGICVLGVASSVAFAAWWWRHRAEQSSKVPTLFARLLPLLGFVSFTLTFNLSARRFEPRFLLLQYTALAIYAGLGAARVLTARGLARALGAALALAPVPGLFYVAASVDVSLTYDPRYGVEEYFAASLAPGTLVETYGHNVYLPRFPSQLRVQRVSTEPQKNPMPGVLEITGSPGLAKQRGAEVLVFSEGWAWRYWNAAPQEGTRGRIPPKGVNETAKDPEGRAFFRALFEGSNPDYALVFTGQPPNGLFGCYAIHSSTCMKTYVFRARTAQ